MGDTRDGLARKGKTPYPAGRAPVARVSRDARFTLGRVLEREAFPTHSRPATSIDPRQTVPNQVHTLQRQVGNHATAMLFAQRQTAPVYRQRLTPADPPVPA